MEIDPDVDLEDVRSSVLSWVAPRLRQFPWRDERNPWRILVSEVMLQQTSVGRVIGKWQEFVEAFPTPSVCAQADLAEILCIWQGLGYPRRARNLHESAKIIVSEFAGVVPSTVEELIGLPGVGPYTARAVVAFAFEGEAAVVDTNVGRVLRRLVGRPLGAREVQIVADLFLPEGEAWLWNQAMMDIGAVVCRPRPSCAECPLSHCCLWHGEGPDPCVSATARGQPRFEGSARQARGLLMKALVSGPVRVEDVPSVMNRSPDIAVELMSALVDEGLIRRIENTVVL